MPKALLAAACLRVGARCAIQNTAACCVPQDRAINDLFSLLECLLPADAVIPADLRQLRRVLGVQRPASFAHYACRSGMCFLPPLQPGQDPLALGKCQCPGKHEWFKEVSLPNGRTTIQATGQVRSVWGTRAVVGTAAGWLTVVSANTARQWVHLQAVLQLLLMMMMIILVMILVMLLLLGRAHHAAHTPYSPWALSTTPLCCRVFFMVLCVLRAGVLSSGSCGRCTAAVPHP